MIKLLDRFDKHTFNDTRRSGELEYSEFYRAVRKGAAISSATIPDEELRALFDAVDTDHSGKVSAGGLSQLPWLSLL